MKTKKRVRLRTGGTPESIKARDAARDKSFKEAPRSKRGRILPGYAYKGLLDGYRETGREPKVIAPNDMSRPPMFVMQPSLGKRIIRLIKKGYPFTTVCRYCGVTPKTFKDWLERGKAGQSRDYIKFYENVARAEAYAEMRILRKLQGHENADWRVSAWQLERRWPEHWSKKDRITAEMHVNATVNVDSKENLGRSVVQDDAARELARRLIDGSDFSYAALPEPMFEEEDA